MNFTPVKRTGCKVIFKLTRMKKKLLSAVKTVVTEEEVISMKNVLKRKEN